MEGVGSGASSGTSRRRATREVRGLLARGEVDRIGELGPDSPGILQILLRLTYDPDPGVAWRAVAATGAVAARMAPEDGERVREHLRRLFWLLTEESGGICWRAPETMASVVRGSPERFGEFVPVIVHLLREMAEEDLDHFRAGILWAIGRLGFLAREEVGDVLPALVAALEHEDPGVRGTAAWCLGRVGRAGELARRTELLRDGAGFDLFDAGTLRRTTVASVVRRALSEEPGGP